MEFSSIKESNPWWEKDDWEKTDLHLSNIREQKITWDYSLIKKFEEGIYSISGPRQGGNTSYIKQTIKEL
ncbi:MAG: hypothetical protein AABW67_04560, partial [Nanoarchaeota archaeon]